MIICPKCQAKYQDDALYYCNHCDIDLIEKENELAIVSSIPQSTISAIENDRVNLGVERAKQLARLPRRYPAVLVFLGWDIEPEHAA